MKPGDIVILDKDFNNSSEVEIVWILNHFSKVKDESGYAWEVMTSRLTPKPKDETLL